MPVSTEEEANVEEAYINNRRLDKQARYDIVWRTKLNENKVQVR